MNVGTDDCGIRVQLHGSQLEVRVRTATDHNVYARCTGRQIKGPFSNLNLSMSLKLGRVRFYLAGRGRDFGGGFADRCEKLRTAQKISWSNLRLIWLWDGEVIIHNLASQTILGTSYGLLRVFKS